MGFFGEPYRVIREIGSKKFVETWIDHLPGPCFEREDTREKKIKKGLAPDKKIMLGAKEEEMEIENNGDEVFTSISERRKHGRREN